MVIVQLCSRIAGNRGRRSVAACIVGLVLLVSASSRPCRAADASKGKASSSLRHTKLQYEPLAKGVEYARFQRANPPLVYHVVKIDLRQRKLRLRVLSPPPAGGGGKASVSAMALSYGSLTNTVVAVINGDYFDQGVDGPWGIQVQDGHLLYSPTGRAALLVDAQGLPLIERPTLALEAQFAGNLKWHPVLDMNRPRSGKETGFHLYAASGHFSSAPATRAAAVIQCERPALGRTVTGKMTHIFRGDTSVAAPGEGLLLTYCSRSGSAPWERYFREGASVRIRATLKPNATGAIGGGPRLLHRGRPGIEFEAEKFSAAHAAYLRQRHPRSAVGITMDRRTVFFVVAEGRSATSRGLDAEELTDVLMGLEACEAMMFDGGGSATLHTAKHVVTGEPGERNVCNALAVVQAR